MATIGASLAGGLADLVESAASSCPATTAGRNRRDPDNTFTYLTSSYGHLRPVRIWLKNVPSAWVAIVETLASPDELAVWQASGYRAWSQAQPGDLALFRPEGRARVIVGHGVYLGTTRHFARAAHALFGVRLGVEHRDDLLSQIEARRRGPAGRDPVIAMALFSNPRVFPADLPFELPWPLDDADIGIPLCSARSGRGRTLLAALRDHGRPRAGLGDAAQRSPAVDHRDHARRPGWSSLRSLTMRLYAHRSAITGERVSVVQDVVHLRPRNKRGPDAVGNLITLEADYHRLVERNLLAFDDDHRVMLSGQLSMFEDTKYLQLDGLNLCPRLFGPAWPDETSLRWLREHFKGPRYKA